ncbi:MAG: WD40 repeat domain-containing protein [Bacteroidota bacterium]
MQSIKPINALLVIILFSTIYGCNPPKKEAESQQQSDPQWLFWGVDWHPEQNQIALGGSNDTFFKIISTDNFQEVKSYPYKGTITNTKWNPAGNRLAISVQDGKSNSIILNLETNKMIALDSITNDGARAVGWNQSGVLLAVGDNEGYLSFYDENGQLLRKTDTGQKGLMSLDWHPATNRVVAVGDNISIYDYESDSLLNIEDRSEQILMLSVDWHPGGEFFVTGDYGDFIEHYPPLIQYWTAAGQKIKSIEESKAELRNIRWSADGELLATASDKIRLWSTEGVLMAEQPAKDLLWGLDWNEDGSKLVVTDVARRVIFFDRKLHHLKELQY